MSGKRPRGEDEYIDVDDEDVIEVDDEDDDVAGDEELFDEPDLFDEPVVVHHSTGRSVSTTTGTTHSSGKGNRATPAQNNPVKFAEELQQKYADCCSIITEQMYVPACVAVNEPTTWEEYCKDNRGVKSENRDRPLYVIRAQRINAIEHGIQIHMIKKYGLYDFTMFTGVSDDPTKGGGVIGNIRSSELPRKKGKQRDHWYKLTGLQRGDKPPIPGSIAATVIEDVNNVIKTAFLRRAASVNAGLIDLAVDRAQYTVTREVAPPPVVPVVAPNVLIVEPLDILRRQYREWVDRADATFAGQDDLYDNDFAEAVGYNAPRRDDIAPMEGGALWSGKDVLKKLMPRPVPTLYTDRDVDRYADYTIKERVNEVVLVRDDIVGNSVKLCTIGSGWSWFDRVVPEAVRGVIMRGRETPDIRDEEEYMIYAKHYLDWYATNTRMLADRYKKLIRTKYKYTESEIRHGHENYAAELKEWEEDVALLKQYLMHGGKLHFYNTGEFKTVTVKDVQRAVHDHKETLKQDADCAFVDHWIRLGGDPDVPQLLLQAGRDMQAELVDAMQDLEKKAEEQGKIVMAGKRREEITDILFDYDQHQGEIMEMAEAIREERGMGPVPSLESDDAMDAALLVASTIVTDMKYLARGEDLDLRVRQQIGIMQRKLYFGVRPYGNMHWGEVRKRMTDAYVEANRTGRHNMDLTYAVLGIMRYHAGDGPLNAMMQEQLHQLPANVQAVVERHVKLYETITPDKVSHYEKK